MYTHQEKKQFGDRLKLAINKKFPTGLTVNGIAIQFSLRHNGSVTPQSVHKWLNGYAIPTPDKIATLSDWLNVDSQWLRHGIDEVISPEDLSSIEARALDLFTHLSQNQKFLIIQIMDNFKQNKG